MGRWVLVLGVVLVVGCADGGDVVPSAEYECVDNDTMPCMVADPNGPQYVCINGVWDETMCTGGPVGGNGGS